MYINIDNNEVDGNKGKPKKTSLVFQMKIYKIFPVQENGKSSRKLTKQMKNLYIQKATN